MVNKFVIPFYVDGVHTDVCVLVVFRVVPCLCLCVCACLQISAKAASRASSMKLFPALVRTIKNNRWQRYHMFPRGPTNAEHCEGNVPKTGMINVKEKGIDGGV